MITICTALALKIADVKTDLFIFMWTACLDVILILISILAMYEILKRGYI